MKKFLSLLIVFMLAFSLAVPVSATNSHYDFNGYSLPLYLAFDGDEMSIIDITSDENVLIYKVFDDFYLVVYEAIEYSETDEGSSKWNLLGDVIWFEYDSESDSWVVRDSYVSSLWNYRIAWTSHDLVDDSGNVIISSNLVCDGSSCPATDVNFDGICDDCGMSLAYNLRATPNTYEVVVKHSDSLTLKYSYTETLAGTSFNAVYNDNRITVSFDNPVNHYQYKLVDGEWTDYASYPNQYGSHAISLSGDASILASDMDIYDTNGDPFFQNPLWMTVEKATQGEMANLTSETVGTMKTLVVCGVGLMACLMALSLFGKRWLLFLR